MIAAVRFAAGADLPVAVRGGGHSFPGHSVCDDGIVIDLGPMKGIRVDPEARTARAQAGLLWGELDRETQAFGLATTGGFVSHTGVAGLTLGGGIGWLHRKHGLTIDQLRSVDLVTADGELVKASETENADLFWGVRGGGGNFGIVTEFEFRLHPVGPTVLAGPIFWPMEEAPALLRFYRDWIAEAPDELMTIVVQRRAPAVVRAARAPRRARVVRRLLLRRDRSRRARRFCGRSRRSARRCSTSASRSPISPIRRCSTPPSGTAGGTTSAPATSPSSRDDVIDVMVEHGSGSPRRSRASPSGRWEARSPRVGEDETAFNGRDAGFTFNINGNSQTADGFEAEREWARAYWNALAPHHTSVYVNFLMEEGEERIRQAYGAEKYDRLKALKRTYDPTNFFRLNQNITPS